MNTRIKEYLIEILDKDRVFENAPLSEYTSFKVGGPADFLVQTSESDEIEKLIALASQEKIPYYVIGNGTNMLVSDEGYHGLVILIKDKKNGIVFEESADGATVTVGAGCSLSRFANEAASHGYSGLEFASGIPGSVGGAVVMNAGAYGGEIKDVIKYALVMDSAGNIMKLDRGELELSYRSSVIQRKNLVVLEACFELKKGNAEQIKAEIRELNERRREKQPLDYPSAGSTFKRPEGHFAGKLIEDAGLRGYCVGDAQVSEKHCGFVINKGKATASDIYRLIADVIEKVYSEFGVELEPEIKLLGFDE